MARRLGSRGALCHSAILVRIRVSRHSPTTSWTGRAPLRPHRRWTGDTGDTQATHRRIDIKDELVLAAGLVCSVRQSERGRRDQDVCVLKQHLDLWGSTSAIKTGALSTTNLIALSTFPAQSS